MNKLKVYKGAIGVLLVGLLQAQVGGIIGQYLAIFYTDTVGFSLAFVSNLLFIVIMWDALNDPIEGVIMDNVKHTHHGKYRKISLWANLFLAILTVMLFWIPASMNLSQAMIYAFVINILWRVAYSFVPLMPLTASITAEPTQRMRITSLQRLIILVVGLLVAQFPNVVQWLGAGSNTNGYRYGILLYVIPLFLLSFFGGLIIDERKVALEKEQKFRYRDFLDLFKKNKAFVMFLWFSLTSSLILPFMNVGFIYYIKYIFSEESIVPLFSLAMISFAVGVALSGVVAQWLERKILLMVLYSMLVLVYTAFYVWGNSSITLVYTFYGLVNALMGISLVSASTLNMELMDYHEDKYGERPAGMISAIVQFIGKSQWAIASWVTIRVLSWVGFEANSEMTLATEQGLRMVIFIVPAFFSLITIFTVKLYPISKIQMQEIARRINSKK